MVDSGRKHHRDCSLEAGYGSKPSAETENGISVVGDVNVHGYQHLVVRRTVNAASFGVGFIGGVNVVVDELVQGDGVGDGDFGYKHRDNHLGGGEIGGGSVPIEVEAVSTLGGRRFVDGLVLFRLEAANVSSASQFAGIVGLGSDRAGEELLDESADQQIGIEAPRGFRLVRRPRAIPDGEGGFGGDIVHRRGLESGDGLGGAVDLSPADDTGHARGQDRSKYGDQSDHPDDFH